MSADNPLESLFHARSIAVIGASADPARIGGRPIDYLLRAGYSGVIYPVNSRYESVQGLKCYPSVLDLPAGSVEAAIVAVPAAAVVEVIEQVGAIGAKVATIFSSNFAEVDAEGAALQDELVTTAQRVGVRILGPNTNGWSAAQSQIIGSFGSNWLRPGAVPLREGSVSFVTQSGAFGSFIDAMAQDIGLGFRHFAAVGNEADITFSELLEYMVEDPGVKAVGGYIEGIRDPQRFVRIARRANELGKPLVFMKVGRSDRAKQAAVSHTASLVGDDTVYESVFAECNVIRVEDVMEMLDILYLVEHGMARTNPSLAIISISGGTGVWAADQAGRLGLDIAEFGADTRAKLDSLLPPYGSSLNPVDATAQLVNDPLMLPSALEAILSDENVDACYLAMGLQEATGEMYAERVIEIAASSPKPLLVSWVAGPEGLYDRFRDSPVPVFNDFYRPLVALSRLVEWSTANNPAITRVESLAEPGAHAPDSVRAWAEDEGKRLLGEVGLAVPRSIRVDSPEDAAAATATLGAVVMKAGAADRLLHKTDLGLVRPNIRTPEQAFETFETMTRKVADSIGPDGYLFVEEQADAGVELIVSLVRDDVFGWQVVLGLGGELVELLTESTLRSAPLTKEGARAMIHTNERIAALLSGLRGAEPADVDALCDLLVTVSRIPESEIGGDLQQLELNPVRVHPVGRGTSVLDVVWALESEAALTA